MNFRPASARRSATEVNITPLIDIVFLLLIFFLITTTFSQNAGIEVDLPNATNAEQPQSEAESIILGVTAEGRIIYESQAISKDELRAKLTERLNQREDAQVIVQADTDTPHGTVVEVMDLAKQVGFRNLAIATEAE